MNNIQRKVILIILLTTVWVTLNENFHLATIFVGILISLTTIMMLNLIHPHQSGHYDYHISPLRMIIFILVLIKNIYISAFDTIKHLVKGEINPRVIIVKTKLERSWLKSLVANAITLTPGTVTIDMIKDEFSILWLYPSSNDPDKIKAQIYQDFEDVLEKGDHHA